MTHVCLVQVTLLGLACLVAVHLSGSMLAATADPLAGGHGLARPPAGQTGA